MSEWTNRGIAAFKSGETTLAAEYLQKAVNENPDDGRAWLWLSSITEDASEQAACLLEVLRIEPTNQIAQRRLTALQGSRNAGSQPFVNPFVDELEKPEPTASMAVKTDPFRSIKANTRPIKRWNLFDSQLGLTLLGIVAFIAVLALIGVVVTKLAF